MTILGEHARDSDPADVKLGEVLLKSESHLSDEKGRAYTRREVRVSDESDRDVELYHRYQEAGNFYERALLDNPGWQSTTVENREVIIDDNNQAARWLYYDEEGAPTQMLEWASRFPTAIALEPLQRLEKGGEWFTAGTLDHRTLEYFTFMVDGIGLRSRARVYTGLIAEKSIGKDVLEILSLGSGAAVPNIDTTEAMESNAKGINWNFYDTDPEALSFAKTLVAEKEFVYSTFDYGPEVTDGIEGRSRPKGRSFARAFTDVPDGSVDVVDALGLWEYLSDKTAQNFLRYLYPKLKPGGSLIVSNMLPDRPQREFNRRAVGWPGLNLRGDTHLLDIVSAAHIRTEDVTIIHPTDNVYAVVEIEKPV